MQSGLYHAEVRLPEGYRHPRATVTVQYSNHAMMESRRDRYGSITLPESIDLSNFDTVEVEVIGGRVHKIVVRGALDSQRDVVYVLMPKAGRPWFCKTVWVNLRTDSHRTLDRSRYVL